MKKEAIAELVNVQEVKMTAEQKFFKKLMKQRREKDIKQE